MRSSCLLCVRKHLARAIVAISDRNLWMAVANLEEAEEESCLQYLSLAQEIRNNCRLPLMILLDNKTITEEALVSIRKSVQQILDNIDKGNLPVDTANNAILSTICTSNKTKLCRASILLKEAWMGYPSHKWIAITLLEDIKKTVSIDVVTLIDLALEDIQQDRRTELFSLIDYV